jgi:hypothetical protein
LYHILYIIKKKSKDIIKTTFFYFCILFICMKYKTIKIEEETHNKIKKFCDGENLKINKWCESRLNEALLYTIEYAKLKNKNKSGI